MKRLCITGIIFSLILALYSVDGKCRPEADEAAWQRLTGQKMITGISLSWKNTRKQGKRFIREFLLWPTPIRKSLERAGVKEKVTIEVRYGSKIQKLGSYRPKVKMKDGKQVAVFKSMSRGIRVQKSLYRFALRHHRESTVSPDTGSDAAVAGTPDFQLVFKNSNGEIKAKLAASFTR